MNAYEVLGVPEVASADEIRAAFRRLAFIHHADRGGDAERHALVTRAWNLVGDPERRARYDKRLRAMRAFAGERPEGSGHEPPANWPPGAPPAPPPAGRALYECPACGERRLLERPAGRRGPRCPGCSAAREMRPAAARPAGTRITADDVAELARLAAAILRAVRSRG